MAARSPKLSQIVRESTDAMAWLAESDRAVVALALIQAKAIEEAEDQVKAAGWLGPQLLNTLRSLGGTPADRQSLGVEEVVRGRLAHLRAVGRGDAAAVDATA